MNGLLDVAGAETCPGDNTLAAVANAGAAADPELVAHLSQCASCRELVGDALSDATQDQPRYRVDELLGFGGMGMVVRATDTVLQRAVALKFLWGTDDADIDAVLAEARILARFAHPNIVTVHDAGVLPRLEVPFISMELVAGTSLRQWLAGSRTAKAVVDAFVAAARGLAAAHARDVVHADFKPANVLIRAEDGGVLVTDFGLAQTRWRTEAGSAAVGGTPRYAAPEQRAGPPSPASDQYAFGVALHEALYGRHPSLADDCPSAGCARVPRPLRAVVSRCLQREPEARFGSMDEVIAAIDRATKRRRRMLVAGAVAALAVGGGAVAAIPGRCEAARTEHERVWSQELRSALAQGLGHEAWSRIADEQERWVQAWLDRADANCRGLDSPVVTACLEERWATLEGLTTEITSGDASEPYAGAVALLQLPDADACSDPKAQHAGPSPSAETIARCAQAVATGRAQLLLGNAAEGVAQLQEAAVMAESAGLTGLQARAQVALGVARWRTRDIDAALAELARAAALAAEASLPEVSASALARSARIIGAHRSDFTVAHQQMALARAHAGAAPSPATTRMLDRQEAWILFGEGRYEDAAALVRGVLSEPSADPLTRAAALSDLGTILIRTGAFDEALAAFDESIALRRPLLGSRDIVSAKTRFNKAMLLFQMDRREAALALLTQVEATFAEIAGPQARVTLYAALNRADILVDAGRYGEAEAVLAQPQAIHGSPDSPDLELSRGVRHLGARIALGRGDPADAKRLLNGLIADASRPPVPSPSVVARLQADLAEAELALGDGPAAIRAAERSLTRPELLDVGYRADAYFNLAKAKSFDGGCTEESRGLAARAVAILREHGTKVAEGRARDVQRWVADCSVPPEPTPP